MVFAGCCLALCLLFAPWAGDSVANFGLDAQALAAGEYWRVLTHHFVHVSWPHLLLNLAASGVLLLLFGPELRGRAVLAAALALLLLLSVALVSLAPPRLYVGLSGLLHGLYALAACLALWRDRLSAGAVLAMLFAKVVLEQWRGSSAALAELVGSEIAIEAHLYGVVLGLLLGGLAAALRRAA